MTLTSQASPRRFFAVPALSSPIVLAGMIELLSLLILTIMLISPRPDLRLVAIMLLPALAGCLFRSRHCKAEPTLALAILIAHLVGVAVVFTFAYTAGFESSPAGTKQMLRCGSLLGGACLIAADTALLITGLYGQRRNDNAESPEPQGKMEKEVESPPAVERWACDEQKQEGCIICLQNLEFGEEVAQLPCQHRFHFSCLDTWMRSCSRAPWCPLRCNTCVASLPEETAAHELP